MTRAAQAGIALLAGFAARSGALRPRHVPGHERGRAVVAVGELALRYGGIDRGEQVGVVGGHDLRDRLHRLTLASGNFLPSNVCPALADASRRERYPGFAHAAAHTRHTWLTLVLTPAA